MPDLPISGLPVVTVPSNSYTVAAVSASVTSQMTLAEVAAAISSSFTASQAVTASYAVSASYEINIETSSSYADTASYALTASYVSGSSNSVSSSYALTASYAISASYAPIQVSASYATTASYAISASYAPSPESSSYALTASFWGGGSSYVPYTGATTNVNLGGNDLIADNVLISPAGFGLLAALSRDISGAGFGSLVLKNGATGYLIPTSSLTVDRTYLLPNKSGTVAMLSDVTASGIAFPYTGSAQITGSLGITGSLNVTGGITGSLLGTALTASYWNGALWQLNDTQVTPTGSITDGSRLTWNSGSQKWIAAPSALQVNPIRIFVAADTSNTSAFYFNSMTRTADSSASPNADTAFMITNAIASTASLYLRNNLASTNGVTASLYKNANGSAFTSATLVESLSGSLTQYNVTTFNFTPTAFSQFDSLHFEITPGVGGANTYYGIVTVQ